MARDVVMFAVAVGGIVYWGTEGLAKLALVQAGAVIAEEPV